MLHCDKWHPLPLEYFVTLLRYANTIERASVTIDVPLVVNFVYFLPNTTPEFHAKYQISGTLSPRQMG